jgi:hypothetical protein
MNTNIQKYTIALCDILGFKKTVQSNPVDQVVRSVLIPLKFALNDAINYDVTKDEEFPANITLSQINEQSKIGVSWFSDTILMYTKEDQDENLRKLIYAVARFLFRTSQIPHAQIRCGIAYGEAHIDVKEQIFVGCPIVEAYLLEEDQKWSGGALTEEAANRVPECFRYGQFPIDWPLVCYDAPLKMGAKPSNIAVNWAFGIKDSSFMRWQLEYEYPGPLDWGQYYDICEKFYYTKKFLDTI